MMNSSSEILQLIKEYQTCRLYDSISFDNHNAIALTYHSTVIEGSTLTPTEIKLLIDRGITPKRKPLEHSLMVKDHLAALAFCINSAQIDIGINEKIITYINTLVMKSTGSVYNTVLGTVNATKGEYRKGNVSAGGRYFPGYDKVPGLMKSLINDLQSGITNVSSIIEQLKISFLAHYKLVSIHPFYDGNGRTSRLLMNYIQHYFRLPMGIVYHEDKSEYIKALIDSRETENNELFNNFMSDQYRKFLKQQIREFRIRDITSQ